MSTLRGINQVRAKDPTPRQIEQRAAAIRRQWTDAEEERRRVERIEPLVFWPIAPQDLGLSMEPIESPV